MVRKIIMLTARECLDAVCMMPFLLSMNMGGKYKFEFHDVWHDENAKKLKYNLKPLLEKTGKPDAVPIFVDEERQDAIFAPNIEKLIGWLEGPEWWKKYT